MHVYTYVMIMSSNLRPFPQFIQSIFSALNGTSTSGRLVHDFSELVEMRVSWPEYLIIKNKNISLGLVGGMGGMQGKGEGRGGGYH